MADSAVPACNSGSGAPGLDNKVNLAAGNANSTADRARQLAGEAPHLALRRLRAGYGRMQVIHSIDVAVGRGQFACLIGPNGAGKSTILHAIVGLADVFGGDIEVAGRSVVASSARSLLMQAKIACVLQTNSIFPEMTVEENLLMGGYLLRSRRQAFQAVERIFDSHPVLRDRRRECAAALSGGERRILELSRALITDPDILLLDEPSIGLDPHAIEVVFETLARLHRNDGKTIILVEQNVRKGLQFADLGYLLVSGRIALVDRADRLLEDPQLERLFLGL
jgi:branched-chain amino acid transport system ATP-binding protein